MERLTTDNPRNNTEVALNLAYVKDGQAWVRNGGPAPGYPDVELYDYMRLIIADHGPMSIKADLTDDELGDALYDALFDGIETKEGLCAMLYTLAWAFAELRQRLTAYEDTGLEPEEVQHWKECIATPTMKHLVEMCGKIEVERDRYKKAEAEGRLLALPCKVGDPVYYLTGNPILASGYHFNRVESTKCIGFYFDEKGLQICLYMPHGNHGTYGYFGKTIFITREEAEAALAKERDM